MSRSGYAEDGDNWSLICWRGAVNSAIRGKRGQQFLRELADAMDAMTEKRLIDHELESNGQFCTLGVIGHERGIELSTIDPENPERVATIFGIAPALAREIVYENDERPWSPETPEQRWQRMRKWVDASIVKENDQ